MPKSKSRRALDDSTSPAALLSGTPTAALLSGAAKKVSPVGHHGDRSMPPPPTFALSMLDDAALLNQREIASVLRLSVIAVEKNRVTGRDGLEWVYVNGRPRATVGSLRRRLKQGKPLRRPEFTRAALDQKSAKEVPAASR
jgi:hypothetical protein